MKRESERRHRDKDKMAAYDPFNTDFVNCDSGSDYASSYRHASDGAHNANTYYDDDPSTAKAKMTIKNLSNARSAIKASTNKTADNMFQSNTAREILHELAGGKADGARAAAKEPSSKSGTLASLASASSASNLYKRFTPRKKKRHNTAPNSENFMDYMAERDAFKYVSRASYKSTGLQLKRNLIGNYLHFRRIIVLETTWTWRWCYAQINRKIPYQDHRMLFVRPWAKAENIFSTKPIDFERRNAGNDAFRARSPGN